MSGSERAAESGFRFTAFNVTRVEFARTDTVWHQMPPFELEIRRSSYPGDERSLIVSVGVRVVWQVEGPFSLNVEGVGQFDLDGELDPHALERLSTFQAAALVYTQLRPIARLVAAEAGFPGFLLPTVNFAQMRHSPDAPPSSEPDGRDDISGT